MDARQHVSKQKLQWGNVVLVLQVSICLHRIILCMQMRFCRLVCRWLFCVPFCVFCASRNQMILLCHHVTSEDACASFEWSGSASCTPIFQLAKFIIISRQLRDWTGPTKYCSKGMMGINLYHKILTAPVCQSDNPLSPVWTSPPHLSYIQSTRFAGLL